MPAGDFDYETRGHGYARSADAPIRGSQHRSTLRSNDARTVLNVGAGAGSYEPDDRHVVAVEPSPAMRANDQPSGCPRSTRRRRTLPFDDDSFDAAMATVTVHQWSDGTGASPNFAG